MKRRIRWIILGLLAALIAGCSTQERYEPNWSSLRQHDTPRWLRDGKFGIYTHWGPYAVHGQGPNGTWYSHEVYMDEEGWQRKHFEETFGKLTPNYGYKDLIPMFAAEKFDADEWPPNQEFTDEWYGKIIEVIDNYDPDFIWFDFGLDFMHDSYTKSFLAYYYNKSLTDGDEVVVTFKGHDLPPGVGLVDFELG